MQKFLVIIRASIISAFLLPLFFSGCGMIKIKDGDALIVDIGDRAVYSCRVQESVGYTAEFSISNPDVVRHIITVQKYDHPDKMKSGITGSDEATAEFIFEAVKAGYAEIRITHLFRGREQKSEIIRITVTY